MAQGVKPRYQSEMLKAMPGLQRTNAAFKPDNLNETLRELLTNEDVNVRATAAGLIAAQPQSGENLEALKNAFSLASNSRQNVGRRAARRISGSLQIE